MRALVALAIPAIVGSAGCGGGSDPVVGPPSPSLLDVQVQVFTPRCALPGCHVGSGAPFGLDLSSAAASEANLVGVPSAERPELMRVAPHDSANSYLYWKITGNPGIGGDPMPASGGPLSSGDIDLIASWIDAGAS